MIVNLTNTEVTEVVAALYFIRKNLVFDSEKGWWRFVPGDTLTYEIGKIVELEDIRDKFVRAYEEEVSRHPFAPAIQTF